MTELGAQAIPDATVQGEAPSPRPPFALRGFLRLATPVLAIGGAAIGWWAVWLLCCSGAQRTRWSEQVVLPGDLDTPRNLARGRDISRLGLDVYHSLHHFLPPALRVRARSTL